MQVWLIENIFYKNSMVWERIGRIEKAYKNSTKALLSISDDI